MMITVAVVKNLFSISIDYQAQRTKTGLFTENRAEETAPLKNLL